MSRLRVEIMRDRVVFVYSSEAEAERAFDRLKHLNPTICCHDGYYNAVVVEMERVVIQGGRQ